MPIEIRELKIKAIVSPGEKGTAPALRQEDLVKLKKDITRDVTERIFRMLRQKSER